MINKIKLILTCLIILILDILIILFVNGNTNSSSIIFNFTIRSEQKQTYQVFYSKEGSWNEEQSKFLDYNIINNNQNFILTIPYDTNYIRLDFGYVPSKHFISNIGLYYKKHKFEINPELVKNSKIISMISDISIQNGEIYITTYGNDPYCIIDVSKLGIHDEVTNQQNRDNLTKNLIICVFIDLLILAVIRYNRLILLLPKELFRNRFLIFNLAKNDFKTKYAGSYLGIIWAFVQPIITILVYWFVFQIGFRSGTIDNYPFALWLVAGLVPWFFFSDALLNATNCLLEYSYLVKKIVFPISILPFIKVLSAAFVHLFFLILTIFLFIIGGYLPDLYFLQTFYIVCAC